MEAVLVAMEFVAHVKIQSRIYSTNIKWSNDIFFLFQSLQDVGTLWQRTTLTSSLPAQKPEVAGSPFARPEIIFVRYLLSLPFIFRNSISIIYFSWDWTLKLLSLLAPQPDLTLKPSTPRFSTVNHILRNQAILLAIWRFIAGDGVALTGGTDANYATRCLTDSFAVTAPGSSTANNPTLCGTNTGEHSNNN